MGNSELTWWPVEAGFEISRDGAELLCRQEGGQPLAAVPAQVAATRRYPAWVLVNHPQEAEVAVAAAVKLAAARGMKDHDVAGEAEFLARRLPVAHQPLFLEQAARVLVRRGDRTRAGTLFAQAREVEAAEGLAVDDAAWLAVHREFAAFGALNTKATADFVKGLKTRAKPDVALDTLVRVAVLRTLAGQAPWPQLPKQLSAFAKAAGRDELEVHQGLLEQVTDAGPALQESAAAMWTAWRPMLVRVCARSAAVRGLLLGLLPQPESLDGWWLELLEECGATAGLVGAAEDGVEPVGGRAQWLSRRIEHPTRNAVMRKRSRVRKPLPTQLNELIVRMAPALRADGEPVRVDGSDYWSRRIDVQVLETCLAHGVPVADPKPQAGPDLELWWRNRRPDDDLPAVVADPRFAPVVRQWAANGDAARLWTVPALRPFLTPPAAAETAPHPLDGPLIHGAVYKFGDLVGVSSAAPTRLLYTIRMLTQALRGGRTDVDREVQGLGLSMLLPGRIEWVVVRAVAPITTEERRELLTAFLQVWSESVFADADAQSVITAAGLAEKFPYMAEHGTGWGTAERLRTLIALIGEHGAVPHDAAAASLLAARAGISRYAAELALVGLIGVDSYHPPLMTTAHRKVLGLNPRQLEEGRSELSSIKDQARLDLLAGVLPDDPARLWQPGAMAEVAERLAANWTARFGRKPAVAEATVDAAPDFGATPTAQQVCVALADPSALPLFTRDVDSWLVPGTSGGAAWYGSDQFRASELARWLPVLAKAVGWAYAALPAEDSVRAGVPEAVRLMRQRLSHPGLILSAGSTGSSFPVDELARLFGPAPYSGPVAVEDTTFDDGLTIVATRGSNSRLYFRPACYGLDERTAKLDGVIRYGRENVAAVRFLTGAACEGIIARIEAGGLPAGTCEADPRASVPGLVARIAEQFSLDTDPAALYLQLLALPQPTDARVKAWNRWRPAQHKAAVAALLARGLVVEDKRLKAGRAVFLPGPWTKAAGYPGSRPVEDWKTDLLKPWGIGPDSEWPRVVWTDLFTAAHDRVLGGDVPR